MSEYSLKNKVAIVTGAGRGIGAATARLLAARSAHVCVNDIAEALGHETTSQIRAVGGSAEFLRADVSQPDQVQSMVEAILTTHPRIDIVVNNAGVGGSGTHLKELPTEEWQRIVRTNLDSVFHVCRAVVPSMVKQGGGRIVNLSSIFGLTGAAGSTAYAAAKAGVIGFSKSLARELAPHRITVNVVAPGLIDTPMFRARGIEPGPPWLLWPRLGQPEDVAHVIAFLCSEEAEFITGQVISPNGGGWI